MHLSLCPHTSMYHHHLIMSIWKESLFLSSLLTFSLINGQSTTSIVIEQLPTCINESYVIPLFSSRIIYMTFNQSRLRQLNIYTVHLRTSIVDRKVAQFEGHHQIIRKTFAINNPTNGKSS